MSLGWNEDIKKSLGSCGKNVFIGHNVMITQPENVHLGDNVRIDPFTLITSKLKTGNNVQICSHAVLGGGSQTIILGNWSFIGYGSKLFTGSEDYSGEFGPVNDYWGNNKVFHGDIKFEDFAGIASDVIVFPNVVLPEGVCIGAKSLVVKSAFGKTHPCITDVDLHPLFSREIQKKGHLTKIEWSPLKPYNVYVGNPLRHHKERNKEQIQTLSTDENFIKYPI